IAAREEKMLITGFFGSMYRVAEAVRELGHSGDFNPENMVLTGGGLKGLSLPAGYRDYIFQTFNVAPEHVFHLYGMQETNTIYPKCSAGRYHLAPWVLLLVLDQSGETFFAPGPGEV